MPNVKGDQAGPAVPVDLLSTFLEQFGQLGKAIVQGMLKQAENEDEREVIRSLGGTLENQFIELSSYMRDRARRLSSQQRQEVEQFLRISSAVTLVAGGSGLAKNLASPVVRIGLSNIINEIKKIIQHLGIFGITLPSWVIPLLLLIDEIIHDLFGIGSPRLANTLSRMEQNYLAELTHLSRLQRESQNLNQTNDEEDA